MDVEREHQHLLNELVESAEPDYQKGSAMVMKTGLRVYGVRVPQLRALAREWHAAHTTAAYDDVVALVESLWGAESQEERALAVEILARRPRDIRALTWNHFDRWRHGLDNWGLTDALATAVLGPWILADPGGRTQWLWQLIGDDDVWSRRLALVASVPLVRVKEDVEAAALTLSLIDRVKAERHPMVTKAVSWALREMVKHYRDDVISYLNANHATLAPLVVREVGNKVRTGLKSGRASAASEG
jgi:3-methyladenine DNA glycosylase AlkD